MQKIILTTLRTYSLLGVTQTVIKMALASLSILLAIKNTLVIIKMTYIMVGARRWVKMGWSCIRGILWMGKRLAGKWSPIFRMGASGRSRIVLTKAAKRRMGKSFIALGS
jgi:hypothetical protein